MTVFFDLLLRLILKFKFHFFRFGKGFIFLFKRNKKLKKISFDYFKNWHFDNSYLVIDFKFKNAIYFKVGEIRSFDFSKPLILNLQNLNTNNIEFEVYGFLQKQIFLIDLNKEINLNSKTFRTVIDNISPVEIIRNKTRTKISNLNIARGKPKVTIQNVSINTNKIEIMYNNFNEKDLLW